MKSDSRQRQPRVARRTLSPEALDVVTTRLRIMSEPTRIRLMWLLDQLGGATVQQLCDHMPTTHQNVSKHLAALFQAGMVSRARDGKTVRYELTDWTALWVVEQIAASVSAQLEAQQEHFQT